MTTTISPSAIRFISVRQLGFPAFVPLGGALPVWAARDSKTAHCWAVSLRERWSNWMGMLQPQASEDGRIFGVDIQFGEHGDCF